MEKKKQSADELCARFSAYIRTVVIHAKIDYIRKKQRLVSAVYLDELEHEPVIDFENQYSASEISGSFDFAEERLADAFHSLPLMRQRVLELLFIEELTAIEISVKLNCSLKYVYDQKHLALKRLRMLLEEGFDEK